MRAPGVNRLLESFRDLTREEAIRIRLLAAETDKPFELEEHIFNCRKKNGQDCLVKTARYVRSMYSNPFSSHMWRVTVVLHAIDEILGTYGVEPLGPVKMSGPPYEYLNTGDSYATTLIHNRKTDTLSIGDWGSIAERHPSW